MDAPAATRYHQDLLAAITAHVPIDLGNCPDDVPSSVALSGRANKRKLDAIQQWEGAEEHLPSAYRSGLSLYRQSVSPEIVLDGLSWRDRIEQQILAVLARSVLYLFVVALVALAGLVFHQVYVVESFEHFQADLRIDGSQSEMVRWPDMGWLDHLAVGVTAVVMLVILVAFTFGPRRILRWFGGKRLCADRATSIAARAVRAQVAGGVEANVAIDCAIRLVGEDQVVSERLSRSFQATTDRSNIDRRLESMISHYAAAAEDRLAIVHSLLPVVLLTLVGGLIAIIYGLAVFYPLVVIMKQLGQRI